MKLFALITFLLPAIVLSSPMLPPPDPGSPPSTTWPNCQDTLTCTFAVIEKTTLAQRLTYLRNMEKNFFGPSFNCPDQWRAIEGVIEFFQGKNLGAPGTWVSYTDAGIIEAIQRGGAIALGLSSDTGGNPGSQLWANYMNDKKAGKLNDRAVHDHAWSVAEQTSTDYGKGLGDKNTPGPNQQTKRWFQFTQIFRAMMRNRNLIVTLLKTLDIPGLPFGFVIDWFAQAILDWFTDITQIIPTLCGSDSAWTLSALDIPPLTPESVIKDTALLVKILPAFVWCWIKNIF